MNPRRLSVSILLFVCLAVSTALAQTTTGALSGTVTDANGALVPAATVQATDVATGRVFKTETTEAGIYLLPTLPVGKYSLSVEKQGFKTNVLTGIDVFVALTQTLDVRLDVGDVQQKIEVQAQVELLETTTAQRGQNLNPQFLLNLPLYNGGLRSAEAFLGYMPGVNSAGELSINGSIGRAREVLIDGASLTIPESGGTVFNFPGIEAFNEMRLITSTYNAEYGRIGGGVEAMVSKSGTNAIHGAAFLNIKRDIFEAAGWTVNQNRANAPGFRPKVRFNEEGGAIGGPVWIPKIYNGKNKTFFYFTYAKVVQPAAIAVNAAETVPTALMKQGNFSEVAPIFDPATTQTVNGVTTRQPFPGNIIPKDRFSKIATNLLPFIPDPTSPGTTTNYNYIQTTNTDDYVWSLKLDHSITTKPARVVLYDP